MDKNIAIEFQGVGKQYRLGRVGTGTLQHDLNRFWQTTIRGKEDPYLKIGEVNDRSQKAHSDYVWALKDINFKVEQGDVVGIIGKNGAGKSTLLKLLSHITAPSTGDIFYRGRIASLLEVGTGFHGELTGKENIYMNGAVLGMTKHEIKRKLDDIIEFAGVEKYIDTPVKRYSSGMTVRLGFAVAAFLEPEILVVDEVLTVGDAEFQKRAIGKMDDVAKNGGRTVLFVSHNMAAVRSLCKSGIVLKNGCIDHLGIADECVDHYLQGEACTNCSHSIIEAESIYRVGGLYNRFAFNYLEVTLLNDPNKIATEEPLRMRLKIKHNDFSIKEFQIGVFIANLGGQRVACCYTEPCKAPDKKDIFEVEVIIPHHNLSKGQYTVDLKISQNNYLNPGTEYDQISKVLAFEINYVDINHQRPFGYWFSGYGSSCMRDVEIRLIKKS